MIDTLIETGRAVLHWLGVHKDAVQATAVVLGSISFGYGVLQYRDTLRLRRAEWLQKLFTSFYEKAGYRQMREILDGRHRNPGESAMHAITRLGKESELDDYLNFFEFLAGLRALRQVHRKDALTLFEYWIQRLRSDQEIVAYINGFGYENLWRLLPQVPFSVRHVFVYGTLMSSASPKNPEVSILLKSISRHWRCVGTGFINAQLYDLGRYPGVVLGPSRPHHVFGELYEITDEKKLLRSLDAYEGEEYQRVPVDVYPVDYPVVVAWCYAISEAQATGLSLIPSGKYLPSEPASNETARLS